MHRRDDRESKSLKLFLGAFRTMRLHEDVTVGTASACLGIAAVAAHWRYWFRAAASVEYSGNRVTAKWLWLPDQVSRLSWQGLTPAHRRPRAGSIGCFVGGAWQADGLNVRLSAGPAWPGHWRAWSALTDYSGGGSSLLRAKSTMLRPDRLVQADIIALCVKASDREAAKQIAEHGREGATVISLQMAYSMSMLKRDSTDASRSCAAWSHTTSLSR